MTEATLSFVDVGQGDCTIALDHETGEAVVIDCPVGQHENALLELERLSCRYVRAAVVTHGHLDHFGGVVDLIEALAERFVGRLYVNVDSFLATPVAGPDRGVAGKRYRAMINRLREYGGSVSRADVEVDEQFGSIRLRLVAPTYAELIAALATANPNLASVIAWLSLGSQEVIVGGDAPLDTWERLAGALPTGAIVRWPHHGGSIGGVNDEASQQRLFELTEPEVVAVSVGSVNSHGHPTQSFFDAAASHSSQLICTEASPACVADGGPGGTCAGTIRARVKGASAVELKADVQNHDAVVDAYGAAQCRR